MAAFTAIIPKSIFPPADVLSRVIDDTLKAAAEGARIDFLVTTQTWNGKPEFDVKLEKAGGNVTSEASTTNKIYRFIAHGTRVRYATMTPGFMAKTTPGFIGSGPGRGGVLYISKRRPRPGIQARKFDEIIAKKWTKQLPILMNRALGAEFKRYSRR